MPALDDVAGQVGAGFDVQMAKTLLWQWLESRRNQTAWRANFWFIHRSFTFGDLFPVFTLLLGPEPPTLVDDPNA